MTPTNRGVDMTPEELAIHIAKLRATCAYLHNTLTTEPTQHDLQLARRHAIACPHCAAAVLSYYNNEA